MKTCLNYGLGLTVVCTVLMFVLYFLGYHSEPEKLQSIQGPNTVINLGLTLVFVILGIRAVRENSDDKSLSYGRGVGSGALIGLFSGIASGIIFYIYGSFVNPDFHDIMYEMQMMKLEEQGNVPSEQLETMEGMMRFFTGPAFTSTMAAVVSPIMTTVIALVVSAFLKRNKPEAHEGVAA